MADFLAAPPPPRRWLLEGLLPLGVVGALAAAGGTGKSFLILQLAMAVATGRPFMGLKAGKPGGALVIAAEDERPELHRRVWAIQEQLKAEIVGPVRESSEAWEHLLARLRERLFIAARVGEDNRLTDEMDRTLVSTGRARQIATLANQLPDIKLIVLDPVSRFKSGDENSNAAATRFVEEAEILRAETGATVLFCHHVSKGAMMSEPGRITQDALRGASALVDGVRWAAAMATLPKNHASSLGISPERAGRYARLDVVKNNYGPPWEGLWLERQCGGVLAPTVLEETRRERQAQKADERYHRAIEAVKRLIRRYGPMSSRHLRLEHGGAEGVTGIGEKALRAVLARAADEGLLTERPASDGRQMLLHLPPGEE